MPRVGPPAARPVAPRRMIDGVSFVPASSIAPAVVTVAGTVAVSNFPASQAVTGPFLTDTQLRASAVPVSGPLTNAELRAADVIVDQGAGGTAWAVVQATVPWLVDASNYPVPVNVQGQPILVDASGATVPVSAASLPLPDGAATEATLARANGALQDVGWTALMQADRIEDE